MILWPMEADIKDIWVYQLFLSLSLFYSLYVRWNSDVPSGSVISVSEKSLTPLLLRNIIFVLACLGLDWNVFNIVWPNSL